MTTRPTWDEYFAAIAQTISIRSDCERSKVGAVVVKNNRLKSAGYNGAPAGQPGCDTCPRRLSGVAPGSSYDTGKAACVALHAEQNALLFASRDDCEDATLYTTRSPCDGCWRMIQGSGIRRVVWPEGEQTL